MASEKIDRQAHEVRSLDIAGGVISTGGTFSVAPYMDADYIILYVRRGGFINAITLIPWHISQGDATNISMFTFVGTDWMFNKDAIIRFTTTQDGTFTVSENTGLSVYIDIMAIYL